MNATGAVSPVPTAGLLLGRSLQESRPQTGTGSFDAVFEDAVLEGVVFEGVQGEAQKPGRGTAGRGDDGRQDAESATSAGTAPMPLDGGLPTVPPVLLRPQMSAASKDFVEPSGNVQGSLAEQGELGPQLFVRAGAVQGGTDLPAAPGAAPAGPSVTVLSATKPVQSFRQSTDPGQATLPGPRSPEQSASVAPVTAAGTAVAEATGDLPALQLAHRVGMAAASGQSAAERPASPSLIPVYRDAAGTGVPPAGTALAPGTASPLAAAVAAVTVPPAAAAATVADPGGAAPLTAPAVSASPAPESQHHHLVPQLSRPLFSLSAAPHGQHTMTLNVTPENLGPLTVRAHIDAAGVRIELFAPADAGREAVRSILSDLRRDLEDAGFGASLELSDRNGPSDSGTGGRHGGAEAFGHPTADPLDPPSQAAAVREAVRPDGTATTLDILA